MNRLQVLKKHVTFLIFDSYELRNEHTRRKETNTLLINRDFRVFTDLINHFVTEYSGVAGARDFVADTVRVWFEQSLVEAVVFAREFRGSQHWSDDECDNLISETALTACVLPRWHIFQNVKREVSLKIGAALKRAA